MLAPPPHIQSRHSHPRLPRGGPRSVRIRSLDTSTREYILRYVNRHNRNQRKRTETCGFSMKIMKIAAATAASDVAAAAGADIARAAASSAVMGAMAVVAA